MKLDTGNFVSKRFEMIDNKKKKKKVYIHKQGRGYVDERKTNESITERLIGSKKKKPVQKKAQNKTD